MAWIKLENSHYIELSGKNLSSEGTIVHVAAPCEVTEALPLAQQARVPLCVYTRP